MKNVIQETCMNALYSNKNKDYIEINSLCLPSRVRFNNHIDNSILVGRNQLYSLNDLKNKYENEFPFKEYSNKLLELLENYSKEEISIQSFLEQALSETQTYSNDSLFRENKEKSIDIAYFTNVIKKMAELINDKYRCDFQSSEILTLSLLIQDYYTYYVIVESYFDIHQEGFQSLETVVKSNYFRSYEIAKYLNDVVFILI